MPRHACMNIPACKITGKSVRCLTLCPSSFGGCVWQQKGPMHNLLQASRTYNRLQVLKASLYFSVSPGATHIPSTWVLRCPRASEGSLGLREGAVAPERPVFTRSPSDGRPNVGNIATRLLVAYLSKFSARSSPTCCPKKGVEYMNYKVYSLFIDVMYCKLIVYI